MVTFGILSAKNQVNILENRMKRVVALLQQCPDTERPKRDKAVRKVAAQLLRARTKHLKAERMEVVLAPAGPTLEGRLQREAAVRDGGVEAILLKFRAS
jgi:hypothetical protein